MKMQDPAKVPTDWLHGFGISEAVYMAMRIKTLRKIDECNNSPTCLKELSERRKIALDAAARFYNYSNIPSNQLNNTNTQNSRRRKRKSGLVHRKNKNNT